MQNGGALCFRFFQMLQQFIQDLMRQIFVHNNLSLFPVDDLDAETVGPVWVKNGQRIPTSFRSRVGHESFLLRFAYCLLESCELSLRAAEQSADGSRDQADQEDDDHHQGNRDRSGDVGMARGEPG